MKNIIFLILFWTNSLYGFSQDTLSTEMAMWFVKTSLYDHDIHLIKKGVIFDESLDYYLKECKLLQDSGFVKLTPIDSVYIDAQSSHQVLEVEYLQASQKFSEITSFNVDQGTIEFLLYSYDSIEIISMEYISEVYEIKFRIINPEPTLFYNSHYKGEDVRKGSFEAIRYIKHTGRGWETSRYPFRN
jgi:uncharacterized protein YkuJ